VLFSRLETKSQHTLHVFDSILRWIRSQLSGFVYTPVVCTPAEMIREALVILKEYSTERRLDIQVDIPEDLQLLADNEMLQFVHRNLLHNAMKFSATGGSIHVTCHVHDGNATISFTDGGKGVDADMLPHLFEYRNRERRHGKANGGAGLALIICKDFMDKMGGSIQGLNNTEKGSTFSYTLPLTKKKTISEL